MQKKTKKIIGIVSISAVSALIALVVAFIIYLVVCNAVGNVPYVGGNAVLRVTTQSMGDTIPPGTYILVKRVDPNEIEKGDVIVFSSRDPAIYGRLNTHRVVAVGSENGERAFTTQGDNAVTNPNPDSYKVFDADVRGIYVRNLDALTSVAGVVLSPLGLVLVIFIPATVIMTMSIVDIIKQARALNKSEPTPLTDEEKIALEIERLRREAEESDKENKN